MIPPRPTIQSAEQQPSATDERNMPDEHMAFSEDDVEQDPIERTTGIPDELTEPADDD